MKYCINFERSQNLQIDKSVETLLPVLSLWRQDFLLRSQGFVSKWVPPIFTCLFPTFPARQSRNFGALELPESCSVLLFYHSCCSLHCDVSWCDCVVTFCADNYVGQCTTWQLKLALQAAPASGQCILFHPHDRRFTTPQSDDIIKYLLINAIPLL